MARGRRSGPRASARASLGAGLAALVWGCGAETVPESSPGAPPPQTAAPAADAPSRVFERHIVFLGEDVDSTLVVPWMFSNEDRGAAVERQARGWLSRNGSWEAFHQETWRTDATRAPWRLLPNGPVRFVVGANDALQEVVYERGSRRLEVGFGGLLADWADPGGQAFRIYEGSALLATQRVEGLLLDANRTRTSGPVHGDWAFLASGDSLQIVLDGVRPHDVPVGGASAWARVDFRQLQWTDLHVEWTEFRAFERARRDVPVTWRIAASDGSFEALLQAETAEIEAGEGSGPLLPVYALFEVEGELVVEGIPFPVRGLLGHTQN